MINYPLQLGEVQTRVLQSGDAGPAVIFVHGTGTRADRWLRNLDAIAAQGFRCYAIDLPGHGFASKGGEFDHSVPGYTRVLSDFIDSLGEEKVALVGTSLGGNVAAAYAVAHPEKVSSLALVGAMGLLPLGEETRLRIQKGATSTSREAIANKLSRVIFDASSVSDAFIEEEWRVNTSDGAAASFEALGAFIAHDLDTHVMGEKLHGLGLPLLLVWGDEDKTVPASLAEPAKAMLPEAWLAMIPEAAHSVYWEKPEPFNAILADFLSNRLQPSDTPAARVTGPVGA